MRFRVLLLPLVMALASCGAVDSMRSGFAHSQEVAVDLERSLGAKPQVGFNWMNGSLVQVTVTFEGMPHEPLAQVIQASKAAVAARFQQKPRNLVVAFAVPGG